MDIRRILKLSLAVLALQATVGTSLGAQATEKVPAKDSVGDTLAAAGFTVATVSMVGIMYIYRSVDAAAEGRHLKLMRELRRSSTTESFIKSQQRVTLMRAELEALTQTPLADPEEQFKAVQDLKMRLQEEVSARNTFARNTLGQVLNRADDITLEEGQRLTRVRENALRRMEARLEPAYARTNPLFVVALGATLLAVAGTRPELHDMEFADLFAAMGVEDQERVSKVLAHELAPKDPNAAPTLDDLWSDH